jgi:hypothetical protein
MRHPEEGGSAILACPERSRMGEDLIPLAASIKRRGELAFLQVSLYMCLHGRWPPRCAFRRTVFSVGWNGVFDQ